MKERLFTCIGGPMNGERRTSEFIYNSNIIGSYYIQYNNSGRSKTDEKAVFIHNSLVVVPKKVKRERLT
jgi:hypothetical protein